MAGHRRDGDGDGGGGDAEAGADGHRGAAFHPIGLVARLIGVSPGLLRLWERERLIVPRRTAGGHRLYSGDDLRRLRQIVRLRRLDRLNAAAIRRELGPASPLPAPADADATAPPGTTTGTAVEPDLGARLRATRTTRGWSLATAAERAELSVSFLSAVERGQANPSVGTLFKLADAYGTTVPALGAARPGAECPLVRPAERPRVLAAGGSVLIEDLIARPGALEAQRIEVQPGGGSDDAYTHPGEEMVYVLAGEVSFWLDAGERHDLAPGDALHFRSTRPHRWRNDGDAPASLLWINVPVVAPTPATGVHRGAAHRRPAGPDSAERPAPPCPPTNPNPSLPDA